MGQWSYRWRSWESGGIFVWWQWWWMWRMLWFLSVSRSNGPVLMAKVCSKADGLTDELYKNIFYLACASSWSIPLKIHPHNRWRFTIFIQVSGPWKVGFISGSRTVSGTLSLSFFSFTRIPLLHDRHGVHWDRSTTCLGTSPRSFWICVCLGICVPERFLLTYDNSGLSQALKDCAAGTFGGIMQVLVGQVNIITTTYSTYVI